jgi:hypothetical protein
MKALDFVRTKKGSLAIVAVTTDGGKSASITFIDPKVREHNAWYDENELTVINSLSRLLASEMLSHCSSEDIDLHFPLQK